MKIKILQSIAGHSEPRYALADFSFPPGAVVDVQSELARAWIAGDIALAADKSDKLTMPVEVYTLKVKARPAEPATPVQPDLPGSEA
jgi:hypothetical protein